MRGRSVHARDTGDIWDDGVLGRRHARAAAGGGLRGRPAHDESRPPAPAGHRRGSRRRDARLGGGEGRYALHALVPAHDRRHRREARQLYRAGRPRRRADGVLRQGAHPRRAGRVQLPLRRPARHLRGARLHRLGPDQLRLYPRRRALYTHGLLLLRRRGPRPEDPAAAQHGGAEQTGRARAEALRPRRRHRRVAHGRRRAGVLPRRARHVRAPRRTSSIPAARSSAPSRPRARRWTTTTSAP